MAPETRQLVGSFEQIRAFLLGDLGRLVQLEPGVNYAATLVVMSGCEVLGRLRYGRKSAGHEFFRDYMLPREWQPVAKDLFDALRNGLAHVYDTKAIVQVDRYAVEVVVSWQDEPHLSVDATGHCLFVNVQALVAGFREALDRYWKDLEAQPALRNRYVKWLSMGREVNVKTARGRQAWRRLLRLE